MGKKTEDKRYRPIGVFDSGLGGLTVVAALERILPNEDIVYLGDTARVPYGDKSPETVARFGLENARTLLRYNVKLIVAACNTVSSTALPHIRSELRKDSIDIPLLGVVEAGIEALLSIAPQPRSVAVIGTRATIASGAYERGIRGKASGMEITSIPCPILAPIVEDGLHDHEIAVAALKHYLKPLIASPPDALLLGCTHYPLLVESIEKTIPRSVEIVDSASAMAAATTRTLEKHALAKPADAAEGKKTFLSTDSPELFAERAGRFLGTESIPDATFP